MTIQHQRPEQGRARAMITAIVAFAAGSILLLWSWNTLAADLFQMPEAGFKHALAFAGMIAVTILIRRSVAGVVSGGLAASGRRPRDAS